MKVRLEVLILGTFIPVLMESGTKRDGKNLISWKKFIRGIIAQVIMMLLIINMVLSVEHR